MQCYRERNYIRLPDVASKYIMPRHTHRTHPKVCQVRACIGSCTTCKSTVARPVSGSRKMLPMVSVCTPTFWPRLATLLHLYVCGVDAKDVGISNLSHRPQGTRMVPLPAFIDANNWDLSHGRPEWTGFWRVVAKYCPHDTFGKFPGVHSRRVLTRYVTLWDSWGRKFAEVATPSC